MPNSFQFVIGCSVYNVLWFFFKTHIHSFLVMVVRKYYYVHISNWWHSRKMILHTLIQFFKKVFANFASNGRPWYPELSPPRTRLYEEIVSPEHWQFPPRYWDSQSRQRRNGTQCVNNNEVYSFSFIVISKTRCTASLVFLFKSKFAFRMISLF